MLGKLKSNSLLTHSVAGPIMTENTDEKKIVGLLPMGLAETNEDVRTGQKCFSILQKVIAAITLILISIGFYLLILRLLQNDDVIHDTEIIVVSDFHETQNGSIFQDQMEILFRINKTLFPSERRKRDTISISKKRQEKAVLENNVKFKDNKIQRAKKIIAEHDVLCNEENHKDVCRDLVMRLKALTENNFSNHRENKESVHSILKENNNINEVNKELKTVNDFSSTEVSKRETNPIHSHNLLNSGNFQHQEMSDQIHMVNHHSMAHPRDVPSPQIPDNCLLKQLMRQSYPNLHGVFDNPVPEYQPIIPSFPRQFPLDFIPVPHNREVEATKYEPHPQDIAIAMKFITPKHEISKDAQANVSISEVECPIGTVSCDTGNLCVGEKKWCDGTVDCDDVSDESRCSCKSRVDESRICDGYYDCPFGEDEMGCFGCSEDTFNCQDLNFNTKGTCFSKEQRCNNIADCPNHKDEIDCTMLAPSLHKKPLFAVSNTEGYLHRNFKGNWYAVCNNPYMWAHDACRRETGLIIRPPFIQVVQIDPLLKVNYISTSSGGFIHTSNSCMNSSAVYVTCPNLLCGTRVLTTSQLLKENAVIENHLFGRNKRHFLQGRSYPGIFYGDRVKRYVIDNIAKPEKAFNYLSKKKIDEVRRKRAQGRVVGGKPSQPAAWPWMVALYRDGSFHCGAVIINQNWVMSAAHCAHKFWQHYYEVQVGMLRRFSFSPQEHNHRVTHIIVNQNYNQEDMKNDLSLLRVKPDIKFSRWVRPICLPSPEVAGGDWMWGPEAGTICTAVGWGATVERGPDPDHLREVEVPIWEKCKHQEDQAGKEICAGLVEGGRDTCQGDSGGPLLCRNPLNTHQWYIAGIVSHGDGCARKGEPGVYTRVSLFVSWIRYHISSKILPIIQPKHECPGFRCDSGISKCLPKNRMCDKIIDCLDGEDEYNCDRVKPSHTNMIFDLITREANLSSNSNEKSSVIDETPYNQNYSLSSGTSTENCTDHMGGSEETITTPISTTFSYTVFPPLTNQNIVENQVIQNKSTEDKSFPISTQKPLKSVDNNKLQDDLSHPSTIEIANEDYSLENEHKDNLDDNVTIDPISKTSIKEDAEQKTINIVSKFPIESMSSILEQNSMQQSVNFGLEDSKDYTTIALLSEQSFYSENVETTTKKWEINYFTSTEEPEYITIIESMENSNISIGHNNSDQNLHELVLPNLDDTNKLNKIKAVNDTSNINDPDQVISESTNIKNMYNQELLNSNEIFADEFANIMISELQTARKRKKILIPTAFQCRRIYQNVPFMARCDHKADCEDGTDEQECTCIDYLTTYDNNLICDGNFDCEDGQDEIDCFTCEDQHFLCQSSQTCLASKYVCDGIPQCPLGEDEIDCFALSNGKHILYDFNGRPELNLEGYLTKKHINNWKIVCEDDISRRQQEEAASNICHYLGFSSANRYTIKYINLKEEQLKMVENKKSKRNVDNKVPIIFAYKANNDNDQLNNVINNPEVIKEECVPNVTRTCMALYIHCDHSLFTNFQSNQELRSNKEIKDTTNQIWPWIAKLYIDGKYKCSGVLIDLSWVLVNQFCFNSVTLGYHFISVVLGSHKTLSSIIGPYEQVYQVDKNKNLYRSKVTLLHLKEPAVYSQVVKPMVIMSTYYEDSKNTTCVAVGQDKNNQTFSIFLKEIDDCDLQNRCFIRQENHTSCHLSVDSQWAGIITCHSKQGWYPAASFVENKRDCTPTDRIVATDIGNLKHEIKYYEEKAKSNSIVQNVLDDCDGARCKRGMCVKLRNVCNGVTDCEDGADESKEACSKKIDICNRDPHQGGCECPVGQLKCRNGKCIQKELFKDGHDDCGDGTDEPGQTICSDYLSRVMPSRLCDGILHCHDRSDEDPIFCKCYAKKAYKCSGMPSNEEFCVATDMVCDNVRDCPNGDDERTCMGLRAPKGTSHGSGEVIVRSHGVWHSKCYPTQNHTRSELEAICRELGFIGGHAKQLPTPETMRDPYNNVVIDNFSDIILNSNTTIKLRNSQTPIAHAIVDVKENCYPVFIECL